MKNKVKNIKDAKDYFEGFKNVKDNIYCNNIDNLFKKSPLINLTLYE